MHSWRRVVLACALLVGTAGVVIASNTEPAAAHCHPNCSTSPPVEIDGDELNGNLRAQYEALQNGGSGSGSPPPPCDWTDADGEERDDGELRWELFSSQGDVFDEDDVEYEDDGNGSYYSYWCWHDEMADMDLANSNGMQEVPPDIAGNCGDMGEDSTFYICYFDEIDPEGLATLAVDDFVEQLGRPDPQLNPEDLTLVNFDTWLWVDGIPAESEGPQEYKRMEVPGQWVETTGSVAGVEWDMGDGEDPKECPVTTDEQSAEQNCRYEYARSSAGQPGEAFQGSAAVVWEVNYVGAINDVPVDGNLSVRFEEPFEIQVAESQAIITRWR